MNARTELLKMGLLAGLSTLAISCGGGSSKPLTEDDFCVQKSTKECEIADTCSVTATDCQTARKKVSSSSNSSSLLPKRHPAVVCLSPVPEE